VALPPKPRLSIIMPAYNEERRLPGALARLDGYLATLDRAVEVVVVENGSTDRTAAVVVESQQSMPVISDE